MRSLKLFFVMLFAVANLAAWISAAEEPTPPASEQVRQVHDAIAQYRMRITTPTPAAEVSLVARPLLTFGDAARNNEAGTLWTWTAGKRPLAFVEIFRPGGNDPNWIHAITLTSSDLVELKLAENQTWQPQKAQRQVCTLPKDVAVVAETPVQRLRQMKDISRRFQAHEFWDPNNSRFELRLLVQPVYRYSDEATQVVDAAVFALAHGTNPEVLLIVEAIKKNNVATWHYDLVRLGSAEMHAAWDEQEVWTVPRTPGVVGLPTDPYWLCILPDPTRRALPQPASP